jgi:hypothetical protein
MPFPTEKKLKRPLFKWRRFAAFASLIGAAALIVVYYADQDAHSGHEQEKALRSATAQPSRGQQEPSAEAEVQPDRQLISQLEHISQQARHMGAEERRLVFADFAAPLGAREISQLLAALATRDDALFRDEWRAALLTCLTLTDPRAAAELALTLSDERKSLQRVIAQWANADLQSAARWLVATSDLDSQELLAPLLVSRLELSGERSAADFIAALPRSKTRDQLLGDLVGRWSLKKLDDAIRWAKQLPDGEIQNSALAHLGYRWIETNPEEAIGYAEKLGAENSHLLAALSAQWTRKTPEAAAAWASQLSDVTQRKQVLPSLVATWAEAAPIDASKFVESLPTEEARASSVVSLVSGWARQDPRAAVDWVAKLPPGEVQDGAYLQLAAAWGTHDLPGAGEWVVALPEGKGRDGAIDVFASMVADSQPAVAFVLAEDISSPDLRNQRMADVARKWMEVAPEKAVQALAESSLPEEYLSRIYQSHSGLRMPHAADQ